VRARVGADTRGRSTEARARSCSAVARGPEGWVVIVGAGYPGGRKLLPRKYAVADAEAVYALLTEAAGFKKDNVLLLADCTERKPTLRNVKVALQTFLVRSQADDTVIMYLVLHAERCQSRRPIPDGAPACRVSSHLRWNRRGARDSLPGLQLFRNGGRADGAADLNRDGIVSLHELYDYVNQQTTRRSRAISGNQHPMMKGELEAEFPLIRVPRP
jgi:hypothetical protein